MKVSFPKKTAFRLATLFLALLLTACASGPGFQSSETRAQMRTANRAYDSGDWSGAAALFEEIAVQQQQPVFSRTMLRAADARILAEDWQLARLNTSRISESALNQPDIAWLQLLRAELALRRGDLESSESYLLQLERLPGILFPRLEVLSSRLQAQKSAPDTRALARFAQTTASLDVNSPGDVATAMHLLDRVSSSRLSQVAVSTISDESLSGWLDLALLLRASMFSSAGLPEDIEAWKELHTTHALSAENAIRAVRRYMGNFRPPRNIAVFLPVEGRYAPAAAAIRDGIMHAYHASDRQSTLRFYQVDGPHHVARAYIDAREDGVDWIIGPLDKESVQTMLELPGFNVPALLLNQASDLSLVDLAQIDQLFSFALLPEDEARQMAELAILQGMTSAAILAPDNSWGDRIAAEFSTHFAAAGGKVLQLAHYTADDADHSPMLKYMLKIDESEARQSALERLLRQPLVFEPQRRDDLDVIFLAARPRQGRLIKPQLRFFDAAEIPVYSTSQLYSGKPDNRADRDLNNVGLPLSPIQLERSQRNNDGLETTEAPSRRQGQMDSFFGLGFDAINLLPYIELLAYNPELAYPGKSGRLAIGAQGNIERTLEWVRFRNGRIRSWDPF